MKERLAGVSVSILALFIGCPALAQDGQGAGQGAQGQQANQDGGLGEIIVTAQRKAESLQKVPLAVTALSADILETRKITSLTAFSTQVTPGLVVNAFAGGSPVPTFHMRGVSSPDPTTGLTEQGVAVYIDGVPLGRAPGVGIELGDVERIEVLRGPQGTLFGRNAEGGAVQFVTKRPTGQLGGQFEAEYGNYDSKRVTGHLNLPAVGHLSFKLSAIYSSHDGYTKNVRPRAFDTVNPDDINDFGAYEQKGFRVAALWDPTSNFTALYAFDYADVAYTNDISLRVNGRQPSEIAFCANPAFAATYCSDPANLVANVYQNTLAGVPANTRPTSSNLPIYMPFSKDRTRGHQLTLEWHATDRLQIKSISAYRTLNAEEYPNNGESIGFVQLVPTSLFPAAGAANGTLSNFVAFSGITNPGRVKQNQKSEELQAIYKDDHFNGTAGLFYYNEHVKDMRRTVNTLLYFYDPADPSRLQGVAVQPTTLSPTSNETVFDAEAKSYAAYAQGTYTPPILDERLHLTAGLRYTHDRKTFNRLVFLGAADGQTSTVFKAGRVDPAFILAFDINQDINTYFKYAQAYRTGGANIRDLVGLTPYGSEVNKSFELGVKSQLFDRHVRLNLAAFRSTVSDVQVSTQNLVSNPGSTTGRNLPGDIRIWGIESELTVAPVTGLTLTANYSYLKVDAPSLFVTDIGSFRYLPPNSPKHQLYLGIDYATPLTSEVKLALHGDYNYQSHSTTAPLVPADGSVVDPGRTLNNFNARMAIQHIPLSGDVTGEISLFMRNIFNKVGNEFTYGAATTDPTAAPSGNVFLTPPRTYGIQFKIEF